MTDNDTFTVEGVIGRWVSLPALLISVFWVCIWFLWPTKPAEWGRALSRGGARVVVESSAVPVGHEWYLAPEVFALPTPVGFSAPPVAIGMPDERAAVTPTVVAPMLQEIPPGDKVSAFTGTSAAEGSMRIENSVFKLPVSRSSAFAVAGEKRARLTVWMDRTLEDEGLKLPVFQEDVFQDGTEAFQVIAYLQMEESGRVAHVFLEKPCQISSVNDWIVRQLYRAQSTNAGAPAAGRVVVNWVK